MRTEITIYGADVAGANYITWAPVHSSIRLVESDGGANFVDVLLQNQNPGGKGGQVVFRNTIPAARQDRLQLRLPTDGTSVDFFIAGEFGRPSEDDKDAVIEVVEANTEAVLATKALMVRIRKNANDLTEDERFRFLAAFAKLNESGRFRDFRDMHTWIAVQEGHGRAGFLPWHRAYLLDLERELQQIDPSVALPYWKFDEPAPNLFTPEFIGVSDGSPEVKFDLDNPLFYWKTENQQVIRRSPFFTPSKSPATNASGQPVESQEGTLTLGGDENLYATFRDKMEKNPHNRAHGSFSGFLSNPDTAPRDPLFFLLHTNLDRLWALWQSGPQKQPSRRFDSKDPATYEFLGSAEDPGAEIVGHNLKDTMWPWNQEMNPPRPSTAPGGDFPASPTENAPGLTPRVGDMIDYQGRINPENCLGFDYDDIPFQFEF